jgi:Macrocin-O-methyltransferase (TylF)
MKHTASLRSLTASAIYRMARAVAPHVYAQDGLISVHNHDFLRDPAFQSAYARGVKALRGGEDYNWHWRVHIALWAATTACGVDGDFVECGVNRGFMSSAIMEHLDWDSRGRMFYLLDTFSGLDVRFVSPVEAQSGSLDRNRRELSSGFYVDGVASVVDNFAQWKQVRIVVGAVPDTLVQVDASKIAYLHLDMNCAPPEVAAAEHFWNRLVPGAVVLLDDYAYLGYAEQKKAMDAFAAARGVAICSLPTGQGLFLKPALDRRRGDSREGPPHER